jgi:hypothetical protein
MKAAACFSGTRGLLCQKLLEGINTCLEAGKNRGRHFWAFLEEAGKLGKRKKEVGGTKLSSSSLFRILALETKKPTIFKIIRRDDGTMV